MRVLVADDDDTMRSLYSTSCATLPVSRRWSTPQTALKPCASHAARAARSRFSTSTCRGSTGSKPLFACDGSGRRHASSFIAQIPPASRSARPGLGSPCSTSWISSGWLLGSSGRRRLASAWAGDRGRARAAAGLLLFFVRLRRGQPRAAGALPDVPPRDDVASRAPANSVARGWGSLRVAMGRSPRAAPLAGRCSRAGGGTRPLPSCRVASSLAGRAREKCVGCLSSFCARYSRARRAQDVSQIGDWA